MSSNKRAHESTVKNCIQRLEEDLGGPSSADTHLCMFYEKRHTVRSIVNDSSAKMVLEIGFGVGHLSTWILQSNQEVKVMSIDASTDARAVKGKKFIDRTYPSRHLLLSGEPSQVLATIRSLHTHISFDMAIIHGSDPVHKYLIAMAHFMKDKATIIIDNVATPPHDQQDRTRLRSSEHAAGYDGLLLPLRVLSAGDSKHEGMAICSFSAPIPTDPIATPPEQTLSVAKAHKELNELIQSGGFGTLEGNSGNIPLKTRDLSSIASQPGVSNIMEIGFNAGHSASTFLSANIHSTVVSFDIADHPYVHCAKSFIDKRFFGRHLLIIGDSACSLPAFVSIIGREIFDFVFIDGGHGQQAATADLMHCKSLSRRGATLLLDDALMTKTGKSWIDKPTAVWQQFVQLGHVLHIAEHVYHQPYHTGMFEGSYLHPTTSLSL